MMGKLNGDAYREFLDRYITIGKNILWLTRPEVESIGMEMSKQEAMDYVERGLVLHGKKAIEMPAKIGVHPKGHKDNLMHAMPVYVEDESIAMIKWGVCFPDNRKLGLIQSMGLIIYNDAVTGFPVAILDACWETNRRTGLVSVTSAKYAANQDAKTFGMLGCGCVGTEHVRNIELALKNLETIFIYDVFESAQDKMIETLQPEVKAKIVKAKSIEEVVKSAEVVASATVITNKPEPKIKDEWIRKGQTLLSCDMHSLYEDATPKRADKYLVDDSKAHNLFITYGYYPDGLPNIYAETGEMVAGIKKGRENKDEIIMINNVGMAVDDAMMARPLVDIAIERKMGRLIPL